MPGVPRKSLPDALGAYRGGCLLYTSSAISIYAELSATREHVTAEEIRNLLLGTAFGQETLLGYFRTFIEHFEKRVGVNLSLIHI